MSLNVRDRIRAAILRIQAAILRIRAAILRIRASILRILAAILRIRAAILRIRAAIFRMRALQVYVYLQIRAVQGRIRTSYIRYLSYLSDPELCTPDPMIVNDDSSYTPNI